MLLCLLDCLLVSSQEKDFSQVIRWIDEGKTYVEQDHVIEAVLVSMAENPNTMENEQVSFDYVSNSAGPDISIPLTAVRG